MHIQETIKIAKWEDKYWDMNDQEARIMVEWGITKAYLRWENEKLRVCLQDIPKVCTLPNQNVILSLILMVPLRETLDRLGMEA